MDRKILTIEHVVIVALVIALTVAIWGWSQAYGRLSEGEIAGGLGQFRGEIQEACRNTNSSEGLELCAQKLKDFENALAEYSVAVERSVENNETATTSQTTTP